VAPRLITAALVAVALVGPAGCAGSGSDGPVVTPPPASVGPAASVSAAVAQTRGELARALDAAGYQVTDPRVPYRPAESAALATAPRAVVQVLLAQDLDGGYITIYEFPTAGAATEAGREQAAYLATGPGRVQFPSDTRFEIRQLGTTIVFYAWSPGSTDDPRAAGILPILEGLGTEIPVPR
jgi:hypothetical protein